MDFKDFFIAIGTSAAVLSLVFGLGYFILRIIFDRKAVSDKSLEDSRRRHIQFAIESLKSIVDDHKIIIRQNTRELAETTKNVVELKSVFYSYKEHNEQFLTRMDKFIDDTHKRLEAMEKSTVVKAGKETYILKKGGE